MDYFSHINPGRKLKVHLNQVGENMEEILKNSPPLSLLKAQDVEKLFHYTGLAHDFGKYTTFFQEKLRGNFSGKEAEHGFISACFGFYLFKYKINLDTQRPYPLLSYLAVLHHHGNLRNIDYDTGIVDFPDIKKIKDRQINNLMENHRQIETEYKKIGLKISLKEFESKQAKIEKELKKQGFLYYNNPEEERKELYLLFVNLFSALIDSDKRHAAQVEGSKRHNFSSKLVEQYKKDKFAETEDNEINNMREEIYQNVVKNIDKISLNEKILSFTSPTGSGKTLTSFSAVLKLRERIQNKHGYLPRIIYSLPYTSIIDQNFEVLSEVMSYAQGFSKAPEEFIIKHHHLADIEYSRQEENLSLDEALMLIESWESEVIVSTFIQLFYSILGYKNSFLKKYHNITGSIIILDEVQNIPVKYWGLVNEIFQMLTEKLNCYVLLLTATRPLIFKDNITEILINKEKYFKKMGRTELIPYIEQRDISEFVSYLEDNISHDKSYLIVLNTIKSSIAVYNKLKENLKLPRKDIYYLSTNIYPAQRKNRLKEIENRLENEEKIIVVSTQVVEAGVDIDLDIIYRDLGPVDSLIQIAGRGNREGKKGKSPLYVFNLKKEESSRSFCSLVYGTVHRNISKEILQEREIIKEEEYQKLVESYFLKIKKSQSGITESNELVKAYLEMNFSKKDPSLASFQLIKDNPNYIDMFVITEESREIWNKFKEQVIKEKDFKIQRDNFLNIKQKFNSYIISVPIKLAKNYINHKENYRGVYVANCDLEYYYDRETGFIHEEESWNVDNRLL